jgi:predicted deacylase
MRRTDHLLPSQSPGSQRTLTSWHFGVAGATPRVYIQAGLHADEVPGLLVAHRLLRRLEELELAGQIIGEIVLVPVANPIGLNQMVMGLCQGRFEAGSGRNFNRGFPDLVAAAARALAPRLGDDPRANQRAVRAALSAALAATPAPTELDGLQQILFGLALDADVVLDLHCDGEAALHLFAHSEQLDTAGALAGFLGAQATLHAHEQGGQSFDDALTRQWWELKRRFADRPIPFACFATTIELRGQADVDSAQATADAEGLLRFLGWRGAIAGDGAAAPAARYPATPLNCTEALTAPFGGLVVYHGQVGRWVEAGEALVELIDPLSGHSATLRASADGLYYARVVHRFAHAGTQLCFVAGRQIERSGTLLSA